VVLSRFQAIKLVHEHNIPHIFLTNGGGRMESDKGN